jgi:exodeoxyribonuclease-3
VTAVRIATWNVNSIRARLDHVLTWLADNEPEIVCLQETKVEDQLFPRVPFLELGYQVTVHGGRALAGVATVTKQRPTEVRAGFHDGEPDPNPRILEVVVHGVRVFNLYVPNGTAVGSEAYVYKLDWLRRLRQQLDASYSAKDPLVIVGDFNIAPEDRDVWNPPAFAGRLQFTEPEKEVLRELLEFGLVDCFREHESAGGHFTWFDYRTNGFLRNEGMRIDHVYATEPLASRCTKVVHDAEPRSWDVPSDHLPVVATFDLG